MRYGKLQFSLKLIHNPTKIIDKFAKLKKKTITLRLLKNWET